MIHTEHVHYLAGKQPLKGFLAYDKSKTTHCPAVIIASDWRGLGDFTTDKAEKLAKYGYLVLAADVYGDGVRVETDEEAEQLMQPLFLDRKLLRERILAAFHTIAKHPLCNPYRIAAIGFCFGGLTVIELLRSGAHVRAIVSIHGLYADAIGEMVAKTEPNARKLHGAALLLQGYEDPLLPPADVAKFQKELNDAGVDWQMHIYGHTAHAFTNPHANRPEKGLMFNPPSSRRAWQLMHQFLEENFA